MGTDLRATAQGFFMLSDPTRVAIVRLLAKAPINVSAICKTLGKKQTIVSNHLGTMRLGRLVEGKRTGKTIIYSVNKAAMKGLASSLKSLMPR
jgi:ArsR family transcriptional regulator